jgi:hypothetical protein
MRLRRRSAGEPRGVGLHHTLELLRQPVEPGVDFAEFLPRQRGLALDLGFAFALAASRRQFIMIMTVARAAALRRRLILFRAAAASARAAIVMAGLARIVMT